MHVQGHQVLPAAQVEPALVLVHQQDPIVAGVEGEAEGSRRFCVRQLWWKNGGLKTAAGAKGQTFFSFLFLLDVFSC